MICSILMYQRTWTSLAEVATDMSWILPLRYPRFWLGSSLMLLIAILVMSAIRSPVILTFSHSDKWMHMLAFTFLMIWFSGLVHFRLSPVVAAGLLIYGILIELLQTFFVYRYSETADVLFDLFGILIGWAISAAGLRHWCEKAEACLPDKKTS